MTREQQPDTSALQVAAGGVEQQRLRRVCAVVDRAVSLFVELDVRIDYELDRIGPFLGAANHRSLFDLPLGLAAFHRLGVQPQILFKKAFLPGPLAWFAEKFGVIVVRGEGATAAGIDAVRNGSTLMIMIEGGLFWNPDNPAELGPVKAGIARISKATGAPMVPMAADGTEKVWTKGQWPRFNPFSRKQIRFTVGPPVVSDDEDAQADADRLAATISEMLAS